MNTDWAMVILTFFLALFTLKLWQSTKITIDNNNKFYRQQLRAYIGVTNLKFEKNNEKSIKVNFTLKNFGQTSAIKVNTYIALKLDDNSKNLDFKNLNFKKVTLDSIIFPNDLNTLYQQLDNLDSTTSDLSNNKLHIYIKITYSDIFEKKCETILGFSCDQDNNWSSINNINYLK